MKYSYSLFYNVLGKITIGIVIDYLSVGLNFNIWYKIIFGILSLALIL